MAKVQRDKMANVFWGQVLIGLIMPIMGLWAATQYCASVMPPMGEPLFRLAGYAIYLPWEMLVWAYKYHVLPQQVLETALHIMHAFLFCMLLMMFIMAIRRNRRKPNPTTYGSARWATDDDLKRSALLEDAGIVLAQTADARYSFDVTMQDNDFELAWNMVKPGKKLIRHSGAEHVFCFAPTRSGKTAGLVIPTLLTWTESAFIYDIKKELWYETAGWRRKFSNCICFEPTERGSARYNPLLEIRKGEYEVRDAQNVAEMLVDPDGSKEQRDHWEKTGHQLMVGIILHVLYAEEDKSLAGVAKFISDPERDIYKTLQHMLKYPHTEKGTHPVVAACARSMLNKSENELSGVVSTALTFLGLYQDEIVAENTSYSDFRITDLIDRENPVSLYLVVPPSDIVRLKPLVRLMLNQFGRRLTEKMESRRSRAKQKKKHRLLMMLDEFPSLGRLSFFETSLAYMAGYGIRCFMVAQSLNQIEKVYGNNNSVLDNSHIRITYGANDDGTASRISDLLGETTIERGQINYGGNRFAPLRGHVMETVVESGRKLLTPGEVLQLPHDDALLLVGGMPPYRAKKIKYYQDARFKDRAGLHTPDTEEERKAELKPFSAQNEWLQLAVIQENRDAVKQHYKKLEEKAAPVAAHAALEAELSPHLDAWEDDSEVSHAKLSEESTASPVSENGEDRQRENEKSKGIEMERSLLEGLPL